LRIHSSKYFSEEVFMIVELSKNEIDQISGGPLPAALVVIGKAAAAAATSSTGKAIFAGAAAIAGATAAGIFDD
jgi:lactobin A/cerein 7B family class IIb bacteriocin